jgi:putative ABC transport system permease protein
VLKFLPLLWRNLWGNKRRTVLTMLSVSVALFLWTAMEAVVGALETSTGTTGSALGLVVRRTSSFTDSMPEAFGPMIARVPGVTMVCPVDWFGGVYKEDRPEYFFPQFYADANLILDVLEDVRIPAEQLAAFKQDRAAAVAGGQLAQRLGWKIGDPIALRGTYLPMDPQLRLRGIYHGKDESALYFHREYVETALGRPGQVGMFWVRVDTIETLPVVMDAIDRMFANSEAPTKTETEQVFQASFIAMLGNIQTLITSIGLTVAFAIICMAANTMALAARERVGDVAIMKSLGFHRGHILGLLLAESVVITLAGGVCGAVAAQLVLRTIDVSSGGLFLNLRVAPEAIVRAAGLSMIIGIVSGGIPAWNAAALKPVDGLRRIV